VLLAFIATSSTANAAQGSSAAQESSAISGDVVVYGATAAGCIAAFAASRSGAEQVVLASPYAHVRGMTTGGIMHVDVGNESTIAGITREYFMRVESHYPHKPHPGPAPPSTPAYTCLEKRCVLVAYAMIPNPLTPDAGERANLWLPTSGWQCRNYPCSAMIKIH
jgi:hypothetical protein